MSVLSVSTISSNAATDDLVVKTGNTNGPQIVCYSNGYGVLLKANSTSNNILVNNSVNFLIGNPTISNFLANGQVLLTGILSEDTPISGNTSDWNPGISNVSIIRLEGDSSGNSEPFLSGLVAGANGQVIILTNVGTARIVVRNEDSVNENTAAHRFNLTNHTILDTYQSMKIIYDGTLARWRRLSSVADASQYGITGFGSGPELAGFDYKSQLTKGFWAGGTTPSPAFAAVVSTDRTTYSSETTSSVSGANLSQARYNMATTGNADKGFLAGGSTPAVPGYVSTVDKITYSNETRQATFANTISQARDTFAGSGNGDKGFVIGGFVGAGTADRIIYSTESISAASGANLAAARYLLAAAGNVDKGFFSGGSTGSVVATAERTTYSTETTAAVSGANLSQSRVRLRATGNSDKGFFSGGTGPDASPLLVATSDRTRYSTETTAAVSGANLTTSKDPCGAAGNSDKGFFNDNSADRTTYSSETTAVVTGANLTTGNRFNPSAI